MSVSNIRFGAGCTAEIGMDLRDMSVRRTMVLMDPNLRDLPVVPAPRSSRLGFPRARDEPATATHPGQLVDTHV